MWVGFGLIFLKTVLFGPNLDQAKHDSFKPVAVLIDLGGKKKREQYFEGASTWWRSKKPRRWRNWARKVQPRRGFSRNYSRLMWAARGWPSVQEWSWGRRRHDRPKRWKLILGHWLWPRRWLKYGWAMGAKRHLWTVSVPGDNW